MRLIPRGIASAVTLPARVVGGPLVAPIVGRLLVHRFPQEQYTDPPGDPGFFGPGSATWHVHGDASMLIGGISALMLQTLHPLAMAGVRSEEHTSELQSPVH